ncbi:MAG: xanthine dehydrogenase family protein molybdopterin-binding subunit [Hyphomicrobiales bacterium]|nr:xanthine dehydrogenase family protein molybdopterin-binding subunit [Hyphomicrobiales bacterium]
MTVHDAEQLAAMKFGVGQPVRRGEDPVLVRGEGCYTDDIDMPGQLYAAMALSRHPHGAIRGIDVETAKSMPGVRAVVTGDDLQKAGYGTLDCGVPATNRDGTPLHKTPRPALAVDRVRFVGEPIACVIADTPIAARDAAEAVALDIEPLPAVVDVHAALAEGAPLLHEGVARNVALDYHYGDSEKTAQAFAKAAHVTKLRIVHNRVVVNAMEPRAAIASYDAKDDRFTLTVCTQGVIGMRTQLAKEVLHVPPEKVRIVSKNVGGSFGMKGSVYPEYVPMLHAARLLGRPVKWANDRSGSFLSDHHGRAQEVEGELALDEKGRFLAVRLTGFGDMGAYLTRFGPLIPSLNWVKNVAGPYRTQFIEVSTKCVLTNTVPVGAYRGAGRPEAVYFMERLIDLAAGEMGIDRVALRRRNFIRPKDFPFAAASGQTYDCGDFERLMDEALEAADWKGFPARKRASRKRGKLRGRGISTYLEMTAAMGSELGSIRFEENGDVMLLSGTHDHGQGHQTSFAQIVVDKLGVPFERIRLDQSDSDLLPNGGGTGGSRSIMAGGTAILSTLDKVIERGKAAAAALLEAAVGDIEFAQGRFRIAGTDRSIGITELAAKLRKATGLAPDVPRSLDHAEMSTPIPGVFPNGCHIVEIEIDPETGASRIDRYVSVNDFGTVVNPMLVEGQIHGGAVQGLGQALMEDALYDAEGQLRTGSFMDYAMPRAADTPRFDILHHPVPTSTNLVGAKGCGEAGCSGSLPVVVSAVLDALSDLGIKEIDMPATPLRLWTAIQAAKPA